MHIWHRRRYADYVGIGSSLRLCWFGLPSEVSNWASHQNNSKHSKRKAQVFSACPLIDTVKSSVLCPSWNFLNKASSDVWPLSWSRFSTNQTENPNTCAICQWQPGKWHLTNTDGCHPHRGFIVWGCDITPVRSLVYNMNNRCPSLDPWGMPCRQFTEDQLARFLVTICYLLVRYM